MTGWGDNGKSKGNESLLRRLKVNNYHAKRDSFFSVTFGVSKRVTLCDSPLPIIRHSRRQAGIQTRRSRERRLRRR